MELALIEWMNELHAAENALHTCPPAFATVWREQVGAAAVCKSARASFQLHLGG